MYKLLRMKNTFGTLSRVTTAWAQLDQSLKTTIRNVQSQLNQNCDESCE